MKRYWTALIMIATVALALVVCEQLSPDTQIEFLNLAKQQKHTILLTLASQAALITVMTSRITGEIPGTATAITALIIFAAEIGQLNKSIPTGAQIAVVTFIPIGIAVTNIVPLPKKRQTAWH